MTLVKIRIIKRNPTILIREYALTFEILVIVILEKTADIFMNRKFALTMNQAIANLAANANSNIINSNQRKM
jgi:hypothetical protein